MDRQHVTHINRCVPSKTITIPKRAKFCRSPGSRLPEIRYINAPIFALQITSYKNFVKKSFEFPPSTQYTKWTQQRQPPHQPQLQQRPPLKEPVQGEDRERRRCRNPLKPVFNSRLVALHDSSKMVDTSQRMGTAVLEYLAAEVFTLSCYQIRFSRLLFIVFVIYVDLKCYRCWNWREMRLVITRRIG